MTMPHLIVGNNEDYHAVAVAWALREMGERVVIWDGIAPSEDGGVSLRPDNPEHGITLGVGYYENFKSVWFRRPVRFRGISNIASHVRNFVKSELRYSDSNLAAALAEHTDFVVGKCYMDSTVSKDWQLRRALELGFKIPRTLITNKFDDVGNFINEINPLVLKPFNPFFWHESDSQSFRVAATAVIRTIDELTLDSIEACPCIYQEYIEKKCDLRITVIGNHVFAARISKADGDSYVDWRLGLGGGDFCVEATTLSHEFEEKIIRYVRALGLAYGCLDFVVDVSGEPYFLEINPTGQFLFIEEFLPDYKLLSAFSTMLMTGLFNYEVNQNSDLSLDYFNESNAFQKMLEMRGKIIPKPPLYERIDEN